MMLRMSSLTWAQSTPLLVGSPTPGTSGTGRLGVTGLFVGVAAVVGGLLTVTGGGGVGGGRLGRGIGCGPRLSTDVIKTVNTS